jgi:tetratricopeptide (TPR) repeat protein
MNLTGKQQKKLRAKLKKLSLRNEQNPSDKIEIHDAQTLKTWLRTHKIVLLVLIGIVCLLYLFTLNYAFVSDDIFGILDRNLSDFSWVKMSPLQFVKPLQYYFTHAIFGATPWAFRLPNILSHCGVVIITYAILEKLINKYTAIFTALLVAVHPLMIESVTWISGGGHTNYTLFCLLSLLFYQLKSKSKWYYLASIVSFLIALLISEKAMMFPAVIMLYILLFENMKKNWFLLISFSLLSGFWVLQYAGFMSNRADYLSSNFTKSSTQVSPLIRIPNSIGSYLYLLVWPNELSLYHTDFESNSPKFLIMVTSTLSTLFFGLYAFFRSKKDEWLKPIVFFLGVFYISLLPTLVPGGLVWIVAERYVYFGTIFLLAIIGTLLDRLRQKMKRLDEVIIILGMILILLSIRTFVRNLDWQDADHLWLSAERTSPNSAQNNNNLGDLYSRRGELDKSIYYFTRATVLDSCYGDAYHNLATSYMAVNNLAKATENFYNAIKCKPILWQSHQQLAVIYFNTGDKQKSLEHIDLAIKINPTNQTLLQNRQHILSQ